MDVFERILVPVDGSEGADKALLQAIRVADACKSVISLLYVAYFDGDTDSKIETVSWLPDEAVGSVAKASAAILGRAREKIPPSIACQTHTRTGIPSKKILEFARENEMELIVVGGRGLGIVEGFLLGSVSQSILENARMPVMIVK